MAETLQAAKDMHIVAGAFVSLEKASEIFREFEDRNTKEYEELSRANLRAVAEHVEEVRG